MSIYAVICPNCQKHFQADIESVYIPFQCPFCQSFIVKVDNEPISRNTPPESPYKDRPYKGSSLLQCLDSYIVLDLETTGFDPRRDAIIEISALKVVNGTIKETFSSLVNPNCEIPDIITQITGITNNMVFDKPTIDIVIPQVRSFIENSVVVGHMINFDVNFLYDKSIETGYEAFSNDFIDTLRIARRTLPDMPSYKLGMIAKKLEIEELPSHRAEKDCISAMLCYEKMKNIVRENNINLDFCYCYKSKPRLHINPSELVPETGDFNTEHPLYGKEIVFTGTMKMLREDAMQLAVNKGAVCKNGVTKETNYLVLGDLSYTPNMKGSKSSKQIKAEQNILKGLDTSIISESVFMDMIHEC